MNKYHCKCGADTKLTKLESWGKIIRCASCTEILADNLEMPPPPGSEAALDLGCTCPVLDNARGKGRGDGSFWVTDGCPLHGNFVASWLLKVKGGTL